MSKLPLFLAGLLWSAAGAQFVAPQVTVTPAAAPPTLQVAQTVRIQPARPTARLATGYTTGTLNLTLFSEVPAEVSVTASDPRLVLRGAPGGRIRLGAYALTSLNFVALEAHAGTLEVRNTEGRLIASAPYVVAPAPSVNQSASLNYSPSGNRGTLTYSLSKVPATGLDPRISLNVGVGLDFNTGTAGSNVGISVSW